MVPIFFKFYLGLLYLHLAETQVDKTGVPGVKTIVKGEKVVFLWVLHIFFLCIGSLIQNIHFIIIAIAFAKHVRWRLFEI